MKTKKPKLKIKDLAGKGEKQEIKFLADEEVRVVAGGLRTQGGTCTWCDDCDC